MSESVEYLLRQKSKVQNPKSLVKVVRAHTRELKRATRREHEKSQVEALAGIARQAISSIGEVGKGIADAHGRAVGAWLSNPNPITWAGGAVATYAYLNFLIFVGGNVADKLGLPFLRDILPTNLLATTKETVDQSILNLLGITTFGDKEAPKVTTTTTYWRLDVVSGLSGFYTDKNEAIAAFNQRNFFFIAVQLVEITETFENKVLVSHKEEVIKKGTFR